LREFVLLLIGSVMRCTALAASCERKVYD